MLLVLVILGIFLFSVRTALIVAVTIPFALLFSFICLDWRHIPANLLSIGAIDFGIIVDGSVVMVENIFRVSTQKVQASPPWKLTRELQISLLAPRSSTKNVSIPVPPVRKFDPVPPSRMLFPLTCVTSIASSPEPE